MVVPSAAVAALAPDVLPVSGSKTETIEPGVAAGSADVSRPCLPTKTLRLMVAALLPMAVQVVKSAAPPSP